MLTNNVLHTLHSSCNCYSRLTCLFTSRHMQLFFFHYIAYLIKVKGFLFPSFFYFQKRGMMMACVYSSSITAFMLKRYCRVQIASYNLKIKLCFHLRPSNYSESFLSLRQCKINFFFLNVKMGKTFLGDSSRMQNRHI